MTNLTVEEAREKNLCRICGEEVKQGSQSDMPKGFSASFGELLRADDVPAFRPITYNFGKEYAHTDCLKGLDRAKTAYKVLTRTIREKVVLVHNVSSHKEALEKAEKLGVVQPGKREYSESHVTAVKIKDEQVVRTSEETRIFKHGQD